MGDIFLNASDYTIYLSNEEAQPFQDKSAPAERDEAQLLSSLRRPPSQRKPFRLSMAGPLEDSSGHAARFQACSCFRGQIWSTTVRRSRGARKRLDGGNVNRLQSLQTNFATPYWPADEAKAGDTELPVGIRAVADSLSKVIWSGVPGEQWPTGLILVSGATDSAKSKVARALAYQAIVKSVGHVRRPHPHLLTLEDPIEDLWYKLPLEVDSAQVQKMARQHRVDYTPREIGRDVANLATGLRDALRQTPTVTYIGEVRRPTDWLDVLHFAGTGHLVITTTHASSLVESMATLFRACATTAAAHREYVASRLCAAIHLRAARQETAGTKYEVLAPAVWRRSTAALKDLVADGLSSVLPTFERRPEAGGCYGRQAILAGLLDGSTGIPDDACRALLATALDWDLQGV